MMISVSKAAAILGKRGGRAKTAKKVAAVRENGKKGGRPRKQVTPIPEVQSQEQRA